MPPVFHLDPYESCLDEPGGLYCSMDIDLVSDKPSPLLNMIQEYSEQYLTHYNYSNLHYGICATKACKHHIKENVKGLEESLEACLNETFWKEYQLKTKISDKFTCSQRDKEINIDIYDVMVKWLCYTIIALNIVGSFCSSFHNSESSLGEKLLLSFSISRNWKTLVAPPVDRPDPRFQRLVGVNGMKAMSMILTVAGHSSLVFGINPSNPRSVEKTYHNIMYHILLNGTVIIQTFLVLSGFLLTYNLKIYAEKTPINWKLIPKRISLRFFRFVPAYAVILAITATWFRHLGRGPIWEEVVTTEAETCRRTWWLNLLFIHNYVSNTECMLQSWYASVDMQLCCLGIIFFALVRDTRCRNVGLGLLFLSGIIMPGLHTYFQDLDGSLLETPESLRTVFVNDLTFTNVYKPGHNNLACYVLGIILGHLVYHGQKNNFSLANNRFYRYLYWLAVPCGVSLILTSSMFYNDGPRAPTYIRVLYASLMKPFFGLLISVLVFGMVFKIEDTYRGVLEWKGWTVPNRLSYTVYLIHMIIVRVYLGSNTVQNHASILHMMVLFLGVTSLAFLVAVPIHLMVEAPFAQVVTVLTASRGRTQNNLEGDINGKVKSVKEMNKGKDA